LGKYTQIIVYVHIMGRRNTVIRNKFFKSGTKMW